MTTEELLAATANCWEVDLWADAQYRKPLPAVLVHAELQCIAEDGALRRVRKAKIAAAHAWDPRTVQWGGGVSLHVKD